MVEAGCIEAFLGNLGPGATGTRDKLPELARTRHFSWQTTSHADNGDGHDFPLAVVDLLGHRIIRQSVTHPVRDTMGIHSVDTVSDKVVPPRRIVEANAICLAIRA